MAENLEFMDGFHFGCNWMLLCLMLYGEMEENERNDVRFNHSHFLSFGRNCWKEAMGDSLLALLGK